MAKATKTNGLREQFKATPLKSLKERISNDDSIIGANGNGDYLNLVDGKQLKIRIFPAHPGGEDFYFPKKSYWLTVEKSGGEMGRTTVLDSKVHGNTEMDIVEEYTKMAKKLIGNDAEKLEALVGGGKGMNENLSPSFTWLCYAGIIDGDEKIKPELWEMKKAVRNALNKLALSEDDDDAITTDPFTDPDDGVPILVKYNKNPNRKKGEDYYEVSLPKKMNPRPLTDEELEDFLKLKPLAEIIHGYDIQMFERALEGLQNFDEKYEIGLFENDEWLEHLEVIKAQYEGDDDEKPRKKTTAKSAPEPSKKTVKKVVEEPEEDEEEDENSAEMEAYLDSMDRTELKEYIRKNNLDIVVKKSWSDDDIREKIIEAQSETDDEPESDDDDEDEKPTQRAKLSLADLRKSLQGKK